MLLTPRDAATVLGISERAVRARLKSGRLPGFKRGDRWCIRRRDLPLDDAQRAHLQRRADAIRDAIQAALPTRVAPSLDRRPHSIAAGARSPTTSRPDRACQADRAGSRTTRSR